MSEVKSINFDIVSVNTSEDIAIAALEGFIIEAEKAIKERGIFYVAISGGSTPGRFFELLGETDSGKNIQWDKVQLFWVDERCVRPEEDTSNYGLAAHTFLDKIDIPIENVHRVSGEVSDYSQAVEDYENTIRNVFELKPGKFPEFDLIILGIGDDGHIGSLLPNSYAHFDTEDIVTAVYQMSGLNRITLTHPVICAARKLFLLASGDRKAGILKRVLEGEPDEVKYPVHTLWPIIDKVTWIIDSDAGKLLSI